MNRAAWIDRPGSRLRVRDAPMPRAGADQVVIRSRTVAINPVDWNIQDRGIFIHRWPNILGSDVAGDVVEVGEGVTHLKEGDRVTS